MSASPDWLDQARRLLEAFRAGAGPAAGAGAPDAPGDAPTGVADCRWCPLCQAAAVVRGERPEVSAALADILAATSTALRTFAGETAAPAPSAEPPEEPGPPAPPVQRIELT